MADLYVGRDGRITVGSKKKKESDLVVTPRGTIVVNRVSRTGGTGAFGGSNDIAPVKDNDSWFKTGAFDDGWDFGDITKTIVGSSADLYKNAVQGVLDIGEKTIDAGAYLTGGAAKLLGNKEFAQKTQDFIKKDLIKEEEIANRITSTGSTIGWVNNVLNGGIKAFNPFNTDGNHIEESSVFGDKSDSLAQSGGQLAATIGLQAVGVPWYLTSGATSFGGEAENALNSGATFEEAGVSAGVSALAEVLTEKLFRGSGLGEKGLINLRPQILNKVTNKVANTMIKYGIDMVGEGLEEVASEAISSLGRMSYNDKNLQESLLSEEAFDNYLDSFIGGAVLGGGANVVKAVDSSRSGRDYDTGLTKNEQKVIDTEVTDRVNALEKENGKKLSKKEVANIEKQVKEDLGKGYISTDTIERTLGGETYSKYRNENNTVQSLNNEIKQLEKIVEKDPNTVNPKEYNDAVMRLNTLREELKKYDANTLRSNLDTEISSKIGSDYLLQSSYQEKAKRGKQYTITEQEKSKNENINSWNQSFVDANSNDSTKAHEFNAFGSKIIADKKIKMRAVNYDTLVAEGKMKKTTKDGKTIYTLNGKEVNVNGYKENGVLNVNIQSNRAFETTVGHELGEFIQSSDKNMYQELSNIAIELGKADGTYTEANLQKYNDLYGDLTDNVDSEYVNDKIGELFTNDNFINELGKKPNILKKIIDEVKHLVKMATAGSSENRKLLSLQHKLETKFKESYNTSDISNDTEQGVKYRISDKGTLVDDKGNNVKLETSDVGTNGDLMAIHNLTEEKLNDVLDLGGLPVPSIAITNEQTRSGNEAFGNYAFIFKKDTIDPSNSKNKVYSRDAYTSRFPQITYKLNDSGIESLAKIAGESPSSIENNIEGKTPSQAADYFRRNSKVLNNFLNNNNIKVDDVYKDVGYSYTFSTDENVKNFIKENDVSFEKLLNDNKLRSEFYNLYRESTPETLKNFTDRKIETFEKAFKENNSNIANRLDNDFNAIKNGAQQELDEISTRNEKLKAAEENGYNEYLKDIVSPAFGDKYLRNDVDEFTPSGRRKAFAKLYDEFNLENVTKALTKNGDSGSESAFMHGINEIAGNTSIRFNSIDEIRNNKNLLQSVEESEYKNKLAEVEYNLSNIQDNIIDRGHNNSSNRFIAYDNLGSLIGDSARDFGNGKKVTAESIKNDLKEYGFNATAEETQKLLDIFKEMRNLPTEYFEAKPQRSIGFEEVQTAVIPNDASEKTRQKLTDKGISFVEFDPNIEGDYERVVNQFDDLKFSLSNQNEIAPTRQSNLTYGEDVKLQAVENVQNKIDELTTKVNEILDKVDKQLIGNPITESDLHIIEQQNSEAFNKLDVDNIPYDTTNDEVYAPDEYLIKDNLEFLDKSAKEILSGLTNESSRKVNDLYEQILETNSVKEVENILSDYRNVYEEDPGIKEVKKYIRGLRINVSNLKNQITDFNYFRKSNFGKLKLTNTGNGIDQHYQELAEMYPQYFDNDIKSEADMLETLADFMNQDNRVKVAEMPFEYMDKYANDLYNIAKLSKIEAQNKEIPNNIYDDILPVENVSNENNIAPIREQYEAIEPNREAFNKGVMKRIKEVENDLGYSPKDPTKESSYDEIAKVLDVEPTTENTRNKRKAAIVAANVLDKGLVFENVALKNKNRELMGKWDYTLTSEARAQNVIGNGHYEFDPVSKSSRQVSKSLNDIRAEVDNTGLTKQFYEYMYHKHNVDRMSLEGKYQDTQNKPVFGNDVDAAASQEIVNQYEFSNPEFMDYAQDVYNYLEADRNQLVKEGVISQETADLWQDMYPHYVPIRRVDSKGLNINVPLDTGRTGINAPIKKATGGNTDILPLFDTMAQRTLQTYRATAKNSFGVELKNTLDTTIDSQQTNIDDVIDNIDTQDGLLQENDGKPTFTVFENGEKVTFAITQDMYDAMKPLNDSSILSKTFAPLNVASSIHRGLLTQYNPIFALTNGIKDTQDILINSQHPVKTYAKLPEAWGQYLKKGYWYNEYVNNGGEQNSYFDSQDNTFKTENTGIKKILDLPPLKQIAQLNDFIEIGPRLAEYIASREAGRSVEVSMLDAARVTTNFKAGGNLTKFLNRNGATFLNASTQGAMQQVRNIREAKANGVRGWMSLAAKFTVAGLPAILLNAMLWNDDDEYDELSDYVKQNYYIVGKDDNGNFIRIPKGRTLAVIQEGIKQMESLATGNDEADLKTFIELALNNLAPNNPIENNIFSPILQVANNKTWYGGDLVPTRLQDLPAKEQYDESTDTFSRWLGETLNASPYKINYLLNQYSGGLGDVVMPMMTPEATTNAETTGEQLLAPLKSKFTTNATMNNQNTADFYETSEKLTTEAKKSDATDEDVLKNKFINSVKAEMNDLYKQKRDIQNSNLSRSEKYNQVLEVQRQINDLTENALNEYKNVEVSSNYAKVGDREYRLNKNEEWEKIDDKQLEKQNSVTSSLGIDANDYWGNKEEYDYAYESPGKYGVSKAIGGYDTYKSYSSELNDIKADKDSNGKTISGSRKEKVLDYVNNLDADYGSKIILFKSEYPSDDSYNNDIIDYLNEREDISYQEMVTILTELGMKVDSQGNISW